VAKEKKSLGRDAFEESPSEEKSKALRQLISGKAVKGEADTKFIEMKVELTPANLKHLDNLCKVLAQRGKGKFTRSHLIRIAIALLSTEDF
jgi:hypothetical protein